MQLAVLGAGAWGTALAIRHGAPPPRTPVVPADPAQAQQITHERCNRRYLPEVPLPEDVAVTADFPEALAAVVLEASDRRLVVWRHGKTVEFTDKALDFRAPQPRRQGPRRTSVCGPAPSCVCVLCPMSAGNSPSYPKRRRRSSRSMPTPGRCAPSWAATISA